MVLADGKGVIRKLWGGYSPKIHDGNWLEIHKEWFEENLVGGVVVADNHFMWEKKKI
jgi:hypothetical protein